MMDYRGRVSRAVQYFWKVRTRQHKNQGAATGKKDAGNRSAVTGGKHLDGFIKLLAKLISEAGLPESTIHTTATTLPGYFRPTKNWDLVVAVDGQLLASIEPESGVKNDGFTVSASQSSARHTAMPPRGDRMVACFQKLPKR
jgi:hypothetical protein